MRTIKHNDGVQACWAEVGRSVPCGTDHWAGDADRPFIFRSLAPPPAFHQASVSSLAGIPRRRSRSSHGAFAGWRAAAGMHANPAPWLRQASSGAASTSGSTVIAHRPGIGRLRLCSQSCPGRSIGRSPVTRAAQPDRADVTIVDGAPTTVPQPVAVFDGARATPAAPEPLQSLEDMTAFVERTRAEEVRACNTCLQNLVVRSPFTLRCTHCL